MSQQGQQNRSQPACAAMPRVRSWVRRQRAQAVLDL